MSRFQNCSKAKAASWHTAAPDTEYLLQRYCKDDVMEKWLRLEGKELSPRN